MGWGVITGDERLINTGSANEVKLESGKPKKIALILAPGQEPYSFFQHSLEAEKIENGQTTTVFRTVNCPKTKDNPNAPCPLCDGQQAKRRIRHSSAAFEYDDNQARLLTNGEGVFKPMGLLAKMGVDVTKVDWIVTKTGTTRNDTEYSAVNIPQAAPLVLPEGTIIPDPAEAYKPHTIEQMKEIVEGMGLNWASMIVPPPVQFPSSLRLALDHVIPNTKYKGQTMEQVWNTNRGMIEFFAKSNRITPEKGAAQIILVALGGMSIPGVPNYQLGNTPAPTVLNQAPTNPGPVAGGATPQSTPQPTTPVTPPTANGNEDRVRKIADINKMLQANDKFVKGGYQVIVNTMKEASGGKTSINDFTDAELDKMLELCK